MHSIYDFIIAASHTQCDIDKLQKQFDVIVKNNNLNELFKSSYIHGVFSLIYSKLKLLVVDKDILQIFKDQNRDIAQMNMQRTNELLKVVELFDKNNIKYMAIKGPVLSQLIHNDISTRQYVDLDLLIEKSTAFDAGKLLENNHYRASHDVHFLKNKVLLKIEKDLQFFHKKNDNILELHWKLFTNKDMKSHNVELLFNNSQTVQISQQTIKTLDTEHLLIYLSLHGSKHYWERLSWVVDIDRLISQNTIDWDSVVKNVLDMKNEKMFYLGLLVSFRLFHTELPKYILNKAKSFKGLLPVVDDIVDSYYSNDITNETDNEAIQINNITTMAKVKDTKLQLFRHYFMTFFELKGGDIYVVNLPLVLSPLYYVIRTFRILFKLQKIK